MKYWKPYNKLQEKAPRFDNSAEDVKASRKSEDTDDPVDVWVFEPIAIRLTHLFIRAGISANAVTFMSLLTGVGGSILLYPQNRWINLMGILIISLAAVLDCCDGQVARLTNTSSQVGRVLDGTVDIIKCFATYLVLGFRMMNETIPFTDTVWSVYIWIVILVTMHCHASQARMADYYRGLHLFFLQGSSRSTLARSEDLKRELRSLPKHSLLFKRIYRFLYLVYTKAQELLTPKAQILLDAVEKEKGPVAAKTSEAYVSRSRQYIQLTNTLTYYIRAYGLFVLLMLGIHAFYYPFVIIVLEAVKYYMIAKYERIAKDLYKQFFSGSDSEDQNGRKADRKVL